MKFDRRLGSTAAEAPGKCHSDRIIQTILLEASSVNILGRTGVKENVSVQGDRTYRVTERHALWLSTGAIRYRWTTAVGALEIYELL